MVLLSNFQKKKHRYYILFKENIYARTKFGLDTKEIQSKFSVTLPFDVSKVSLPRKEAELSFRTSRICWICSENFVSIVLKSRATVSILANRAKPNTIEMTDKVEEHMENISLRSLFLLVIFVSDTLLSMANGDTIMKLWFMCDSVEAL